MRLLIRFQLDREVLLPMNHQDLLTGLVYRLLGVSDADYTRTLHEVGYGLDTAEDTRRYKLFVFSGLRVPKGRRKPEGDRLRITPGPVDWLLASPRQDFLLHSATGLLAVGSEVRVGSIPLTITGVESLPTPAFKPTTEFTSLTPIVASVHRPDGTTKYLRPDEPREFSDAVRRNLLRKMEIVSGRPCDDPLELEFGADYLKRNPHSGTKKVTYKGIDIVGVLAPFTLTGSTELMRLAWECGLGEKNSGGFGMVQVDGG